MKRQDIRIRDPFILTDFENKCYYMYGTTDLPVENDIVAGNTFSVYKSYDLENFEDPVIIFDGKEQDFYGICDYWAGEVYKYQGKYYLFGSVKGKNNIRATQIFVSNAPDGKFVPLSLTARTPENMNSIDGTLWVEDGKPYMIFCHGGEEAPQGDICALEFTKDLTKPVGEPFVLFSAPDNPFVEVIPARPDLYCVDGPFLYKEKGKLKMLWSSFLDKKYHVFEATAESIRKPWTHLKGEFMLDGGHAMLFTRLDGARRIAMHSPNIPGKERFVDFDF